MPSPPDPIEDQAYAEIFISCQVAKCMTMFDPTVDEPATDPVEKWAADMSRRARSAGWTVDKDGLVRCPTHRASKVPLFRRG